MIGLRYSALLVGFFLAISVAALIFAFYIVFRLRKLHGFWQIGLLFVMEFIYALGYGLELASDTLLLKVIFNHVQYLVIPFIAITWVYVANLYKNPRYKPKLKHYAPLLVIPVFVLILAQINYFTPNDWNYQSVALDPDWQMGALAMPMLTFVKGPAYYMHAIYNMVLAGFVVYTYLTTYLRSGGYHKKQAMILFISSLIAFIVPITSLFNPESTGLDFALILIVVISFIIFYSMTRYEVFYLKPSAHLATFERSSDPIFILDDIYELVSWNLAMERDPSVASQLKYHMKLEEMFTDKEMVQAIYDNAPISYQRNGRHYVAEVIALESKRNQKNGYLIKINEMTRYVKRIEDLTYQASHDELTAIYNRRAFIERAKHYLEDAHRQGNSFALLMIDIDDFKVVNDTLGHLAGDQALKTISVELAKTLPKGSILSRYGGEEFLVLLKDIGIEDANRVAQVLLDHIRTYPFSYKDQNYQLRISIGIAFTEDGHLPEIYDYIKVSDDALYHSKREGKDQATLIIT